MTLRELLARTPHVLLDFDGPMCAVFTSISSAQATSALAASIEQLGVRVPVDLRQSADPFVLLSFVAEHAPEHTAAAERSLARLEVAGVQAATPTAHLLSALAGLTQAGHTVTVVSNNSAAAVNAFLVAHKLKPYFQGVVARTEPDPTLLKPNPYLLHRAASGLRATAADCVLLGDSVTDVEAAHRAGARSIAFANKPGKRQALDAAGPDALIDSLAEVASVAA